MISSHIYMNKNTDTENNELTDLPPEYIKTDGEYDLFITTLFIIILFLMILIIRFLNIFIKTISNKV